MKSWYIYTFTNLVNNLVYVGQTKTGSARKQKHLYQFAIGKRNTKLYQAMADHGVDNFQFDIICHCLKPEYLNDMERHFIQEFNSIENGYNIRLVGGLSDLDKERLIAEGYHPPTYQRRSRQPRIAKTNLAWRTRKKRLRQNPGIYKDPRDYVARGSAHTKAKSRSYLIKFPDGRQDTVQGLNQFCKEYGLTKKCLFATFNGDQTHHKGFSLLARFTD